MQERQHVISWSRASIISQSVELPLVEFVFSKESLVRIIIFLLIHGLDEAGDREIACPLLFGGEIHTPDSIVPLL